MSEKNLYSPVITAFNPLSNAKVTAQSSYTCHDGTNREESLRLRQRWVVN